ncbi:hypothetical protein GGP50_001383 [Salinibacter ruber]|nr:hypothetical protein [Salinibacter ruber]
MASLFSLMEVHIGTANSLCTGDALPGNSPGAPRGDG